MCYLNFHFFFYFTLILVFKSNGGEALVGGRIVRDSTKYSYHVVIDHLNSYCGGGLLSETYVITAAHCILDNSGWFSNSLIRVFIGTTNLQPVLNDIILRASHEIIADKIYIPHDYLLMKLMPNAPDLAILKLQKPVTMLPNWQHLKFLTMPNPYMTYENKKVSFTGTGYDNFVVQKLPLGDFFKASSSLKLRYVSTTILPEHKCKEYIPRLDNTQICTQRRVECNSIYKGVCYGDSGGPLVYGNNKLVGVLQSGPRDCNENTGPAIYTRITEFLDLINRAMKDDCSKPDMICQSLF